MRKSVWHLHVKVYANVLASHIEVCCVVLRDDLDSGSDDWLHVRARTSASDNPRYINCDPLSIWHPHPRPETFVV